MIREPWRPRCCLSCGDPLEEWAVQLQPGTYVPCVECARLYVVDDDPREQLIPVVLAYEPEWLQGFFHDLVAAHWATPTQPAGDRRPEQRRAA